MYVFIIETEENVQTYTFLVFADDVETLDLLCKSINSYNSHMTSTNTTMKHQ